MPFVVTCRALLNVVRPPSPICSTVVVPLTVRSISTLPDSSCTMNVMISFDSYHIKSYFPESCMMPIPVSVSQAQLEPAYGQPEYRIHHTATYQCQYGSIGVQWTAVSTQVAVPRETWGTVLRSYRDHSFVTMVKSHCTGSESFYDSRHGVSPG